MVKALLKCCGVCLMVVAAGIVGFRLGSIREVTTVETVAEVQEDSVEQFRTRRQQTRQTQLAELNELICGDDEAISDLAKEKLLEILDCQQKEEALESILAVRDFDDALVTVRTDSVDVFLRGTPNEREIAVIYDAVSRETGLNGEKVKIIPIN